MITTDPSSIINTTRYPLVSGEEQFDQNLVDQCRHRLNSDQYIVLEDFITPDALRGILYDAEAVLPDTYFRDTTRSCYITKEIDPTYTPDHPVNKMQSYRIGIIASDLIGKSGMLRRLYEWPCFIRFLADVVDHDRLYLNEDPYQALNILVYQDGCSSAWHFDTGNEFTVTLLLQSATSGGIFSIAPNISSEDEPNYLDVQNVLEGDRTHVTDLHPSPGALVIFRGNHSLHEVSTVNGDRPRLTAVMVYELSPGVIADASLRSIIYGPRAVP